MAARTKKTSARSRKTTRSRKKPQTTRLATALAQTEEESTSVFRVFHPLFKGKPVLTFFLVVGLVVALILPKYRYILIPATVNGQPIYSWDYVTRLHRSGGQQTLEQMAVERLLLQEASSQGITVTQEEIDAAVAELETQFEPLGGIDAFLEAQKLDRKVFEDQLRINIITEKLAGDPEVSQEEIDEYYQTNQADYSDLTIEEAKSEIREILGRQQISNNVRAILTDLRNQADIRVFAPGVDLSQPQSF